MTDETRAFQGHQFWPPARPTVTDETHDVLAAALRADGVRGHFDGLGHDRYYALHDASEMVEPLTLALAERGYSLVPTATLEALEVISAGRHPDGHRGAVMVARAALAALGKQP